MIPLFVWTCTDHDGHWPVGVASVIVANKEEEARALLDAELELRGLLGHVQKPYALKRLDITTPIARILNDGNY
jgi:hypothetical protein